MRTKTYLALSSASLLLASVVFVACGSKTKCTPGQLTMDIELDENAQLADRVVVFTNTPPASVTLPHTPGDISDVYGALTWPSGFPGNKLVDVHFEAYGGVTLLGTDVESVHLGATCTSSLFTIDGDYFPPDLYGVDGIDAGD